jgi:hypothetical protein
MMKQVLIDMVVSGLASLDACGWDYRSPKVKSR